jgi:hypothetical protein
MIMSYFIFINSEEKIMIFDHTKDLLQKTEDIILDVYDGRKRWIRKIDKIINSNTLGFIYTGANPLLIKRIFFITLWLSLIITIWTKIFNDIEFFKFILNVIFALLLAVILAPLSIFSKKLGN